MVLIALSFLSTFHVLSIWLAESPEYMDQGALRPAAAGVIPHMSLYWQFYEAHSNSVGSSLELADLVVH